MRQMIAGNWKMNGTLAGLSAYASALRQGVEGVDLLVCPPFPLIRPLIEALGDASIWVGAQDCDAKRSGPHTGDVSADLLAELGARHVILGHSERRADHGESSTLVRDKARAASAAGLVPVICVGETEAERDAHETETVVRAQLAGSLPDGFSGLIAYEPVWAIGSGKTPSEDEVEAMHRAIRASLKKQLGEAGEAMPILYGGSVKPANAETLMRIPEVGGALVGGASLKAEDFLAIASAAVRD
ncbi:triose-phosphate isomerase [Acidiphilium sp. AL]|uniref:Triosephosphate isomerase n=1 Tax=Acidiphilium iwatense TaxID=768198 RepID=A0ABS9DSU0_9PROT|nr:MULTISPECIES: triose-phosphate isomerase [Acidiphilium]MCF3945803.1 triose-phosphate isomerase [Acidiphilium iwatense]MCU4159346.1 triose-phosphate isomerase [Acidiphilium sp. AL]